MSITTYHIDAIDGTPLAIPDWVHPRIKEWASRNGITPWSHQVEVWSAWHGGIDACITTPTGSGKTLAFTIPILETLLTSTRNVLVLFPLKALANDQVATMSSLLAQFSMSEAVGVIDGDTPMTSRAKQLSSKRVIMTNPYILHANLAKPEWRAWLANVSLVIVDEIHTYSGVFGSEMAWVFRRLWRIAGTGCWHKEGRVIAASATLADPLGHMHELMDRDAVVLVDRSGAASPARTWLVAPFNVKNLQTIIEQQIQANAQTLVYANTRNTVEALAHQLSTAFPGVAIKPYRSGYPQPVREAIEAELRDGTLRIVVSTSALATGIDIGGLDTVVMADLPPDPSILKQVAGRAGRRGQDATIVLLTNPTTPIGALLMNRGGIQQMLNRTASASAQLHNPVILDRQLLLMAAEMPLTPATTPVMADIPVRHAIRRLVAAKDLEYRIDGYHALGRPVPHSLLIQATGTIPLELDRRVIDHLSLERAITQYPPQHMVAYRGSMYRSSWHKTQSQDGGREGTAVVLHPISEDERRSIVETRPQIQRTVSFLNSESVESSYAVIAGEVVVVTRVEYLTVVSPQGSKRRVTYQPPKTASYVTRGMSIQLSAPVDHGFVHALLLEAEAELGVTSSEIAEWHTATQITFYDRDGMRGAVDILVAHIDHLLSAARGRINSCGCAAGCLNCVVLMNCREDTHKDLAPHAVFSLADHTRVVLQPVPREADDTPRGRTLPVRG